MKEFTKKEIIKEYYEFVRFVYSNYPKIIKEYNFKRNKIIKVPIYEYYKDDKEMLRFIK